MPATARDRCQAVRRCMSHRRRNVFCRFALGDHRGAAVNHPVPAKAFGIESGVIAPDQRAGKSCYFHGAPLR